MSCSQIRKLLDAYHDGELDAAHTLQVDAHLAVCQDCFDLTRNLSVLRGTLQNDALRYCAPAGLLRAAITQALQTERDTTIEPERSRHWAWAVAAALLIATIFASQFQPLRSDDRLLAEITASHIRSLMSNHLTDVASTDQHTVKPWFDGKLDFAPTVIDLYSAGFPLLGGRLDYIAGRPVAALVYSGQKHTINVFIWPAESSAIRTPHTSQRDDYRIVQWSDGRMNLAAVSDLGEPQLHEFAVSFCQRSRQLLPSQP